jgi:hypothetical protein
LISHTGTRPGRSGRRQITTAGTPPGRIEDRWYRRPRSTMRQAVEMPAPARAGSNPGIGPIGSSKHRTGPSSPRPRAAPPRRTTAPPRKRARSARSWFQRLRREV